MLQINVDRPFFLFAKCIVQYDGRAKSVLPIGNYVIQHKGDGALIISGNSKVKPLNFQPPGAILTKIDNRLFSQRGEEIIGITIYSIIHYYELMEWSNNKISITMTENDLRQKIVTNIEQYFPDTKEIFKEYQTPVGLIDLVVINNKFNVIEVKRKKGSIIGCTQLDRYMKYFKKIGRDCAGYMMCPSMTAGAIQYLNDNNYSYIKVDF